MLILLWVVLSAVVGVAATTRGRSAATWTVLALILSPLIAGLLFVVLPKLDDREAITANDQEIERNIRAAKRRQLT